LSAAILLAMSGVAILLAVFRKNDKAKHRAILLVLILLLPLGYVFYFGVQAGKVPPIHDISTDLQQPPQPVALLALRGEDANPLDYSTEVAAAQARAYPDIQPAYLAMSKAEALKQVEQVALDMGWKVVNVDPALGLLEATDTTFWFGFVDDILVRVQAEEGRVRVDVRSVSRVGRSDIGKNAARIKDFLQQLAG
jgi:uncharacterized protein (DUF1499 family)